MRLTTVAAALTVVLVALGGAVRAFDAGLACPTWPGCFTAGDFLPPAVVTVWLEHTHRLVAGVVGLLLAATLAWVLVGHRRRRDLAPGRSAGPPPGDLLGLSLAAAVLVVVQALLGALVVWGGLQAELVTAHLGLGTALLALLLVLATRARHVPSHAGDHPGLAVAAGERPSGQARLVRQAAVVAGLVWVQMLVGGHVSGVGSGLAFVDQPALGLAAVGPIASEGAAFNLAHRVLALVVTAAVMWLAARVRRAGAGGWALRLARVSCLLVAAQVLLGVANLLTDLAPQAVVLHLAVASWLWAVLVGLVLALPRVEWPQPPAPVAPAAAQRVAA